MKKLNIGEIVVHVYSKGKHFGGQGRGKLINSLRSWNKLDLFRVQVTIELSKGVCSA